MPDEEQHVAGASVLIDGTDLAADPKYGPHLHEIVVVDNLATPDMAQVRFANALQFIDDAVFDVAKDLEVKFASMTSRTLTSVFKGVIVAIEPEFTDGSATLLLRAYDRSFELARGTKTRTFQDVTTRDILSKVCQEAGLQLGTCDDASVKQDYVMQAGESDWSLIQRLARAQNCEFLVDDRKAIFRKLDAGRTAAPELKYGENLESFAPRITMAQQPEKVVVRGWDPANKQAIVGEAASPQTSHKLGYDVAKISQKAKANGARTLELATRPVTVVDEAKKLAEAALSRLAEAGFEATGVALGDPKLKAGTTVKISQVGTRLSGEYLLSSTTHRYTAQGFRTKFTIAGRNPRTLLDVLGGGAPAAASSDGGGGGGAGGFGGGLVVGIVTNVTDPEKLGRVRVKFPTLSATEESAWARMVTVHAGADRGLLFMPEVDDEVVVGFENGDLRRPYVLGGVFTGRDKPGEGLWKGNGEHDGSLVVASHKKIVLNSKKEYELTVQDKTTIAGKGEWKHVNDSPIVIETKPGQDITIKAGGKLVFEGTQGVNMKGLTVDVEGDTATNIKGKMINVG